MLPCSPPLCPTAGGKLLVLFGGVSKSPATDTIGCEVAVLNADTNVWDKPTSARLLTNLQGHTAVVVGRTKIMSFGGIKNDNPTAEVAVFNTDTLKWMSPQVKGVERPVARSGHACTSIREKMFVFGGITTDGTLLNDLWSFDLDSLSWTYITCFGSKPSPRHGEPGWRKDKCCTSCVLQCPRLEERVRLCPDLGSPHRSSPSLCILGVHAWLTGLAQHERLFVSTNAQPSTWRS